MDFASVVEVQVAVFDVIDASVKDDIDSEFTKALGGVFGVFFVKGFEESRAGLDEDDLEFAEIDGAIVSFESTADEV